MIFSMIKSYAITVMVISKILPACFSSSSILIKIYFDALTNKGFTAMIAAITLKHNGIIRFISRHFGPSISKTFSEIL